MAAVSDTTMALAALTLFHNVVSPKKAADMLEASDGDDSKLFALILQEVREATLLEVIARELKAPFIDLYAPQSPYKADTAILRRCDLEILKRHSGLPLLTADGSVVVATSTLHDMDLRTYMTDRFGHVTMALASREQIQARLSLAGSDMISAIPDQEEQEAAPAPTQAAVAAPAQRSPLVGWFDSVLDACVAQGVSDIHFEQNGDGTMLARLRIDGVLRLLPTALRGRENEVFGIIMNRANMDAANYLVPQDGQFSFVSAARNIDVRVAMAPTVNGPKIVMRLLDSNNVRRRLADMGFSAEHLHTMRSAAQMNQGMVFVSGPTGSGKTTTLYALLREASSVERNVCTIEDPVEYRLPLVNQVQVRSHGDKPVTFASALRNMLRMDPDVILLGEVRDAETAKVALEAAITGHLVMSTVHARDAIGVFTRLTEIGAPAYLVAEAISVSIAQRLIRRLHDCATAGEPSDKEILLFEQLGMDVPDELMRARGCDTCGGSGFRGRVALVEVLTPSSKIREMIVAGSSHDDLIRQARSEGFRSLSDHAATAVVNGATTIDEAAKLLHGADA